MAIYQILAAILHLSNVDVKDQSADRSSILVNTDYPWTQQESTLFCLICLILCQNIILRILTIYDHYYSNCISSQVMSI